MPVSMLSSVDFPLLDLLIIDGGKGQLTMAIEVLQEFGLQDDVPLVGLAKREGGLFRPRQLRSIMLSRRSEGLYLVQRVRDANTGHRKRRAKVRIASILDGIPGIGKKRRTILLKRFGSLDGIRHATEEEIASVPGIPLMVVQSLKAHLD